MQLVGDLTGCLLSFRLPVMHKRFSTDLLYDDGYKAMNPNHCGEAAKKMFDDALTHLLMSSGHSTWSRPEMSSGQNTCSVDR